MESFISKALNNEIVNELIYFTFSFFNLKMSLLHFSSERKNEIYSLQCKPYFLISKKKQPLFSPILPRIYYCAKMPHVVSPRFEHNFWRTWSRNPQMTKRAFNFMAGSKTKIQAIAPELFWEWLSGSGHPSNTFIRHLALKRLIDKRDNK